MSQLDSNAFSQGDGRRTKPLSKQLLDCCRGIWGDASIQSACSTNIGTWVCSPAPMRESQAWQHVPVIPVLERGGYWGLMPSQSCQISDLQVLWETLPQKIRWSGSWRMITSTSGLRMHACMCTHTLNNTQAFPDETLPQTNVRFTIPKGVTIK